MLASANTTRFLFDCPAARQDWRVVGLAAEQGLSSPGWCELELACPRRDLDTGSLIGKAGVLTLFDTDHPTFFHGEIAAASQGPAGKRFSTYRVTLRPKLWQLSFRSGLRVFQDMSVPDIVKKVLKEAGVSAKDIRFELTDSCQPRTYCTQYRESDFAFVSRLLAEEGLFYFFEHSSERHVLVICDNKSSFKPVAGSATLPYAPAAGMVTSEQAVVEFQVLAQMAGGAVTLRDYFFGKPAQQLQSQANTNPFAMLEQYDYPGFFDNAELGRHHAQMRHQARQMSTQIITGRSDSQRLQCGRRFTLAKHARKGFNAEYTLVHVRLQGRQPQVLEEDSSAEGSSFSLDFRAIPAATDFRPPLLHPRPRIEGVQTAFVTGPKGEEIYSDTHGRIKVQFHWDREGKRDQNSSCWLRVAQAWAGNQWGSLVLPRVGQEVLVTFLDGDPDRPLVTGSVYNAATQPPYDLPANKTRTAFKSQSTPGGGGFNELRIEDKKGSEQLFVHAEKDANVFVKSDWKQSVDRDTHLIVQKNAFESVGEDVHLSVAANRNIKTGKTLSDTIGADAQVKVAGNALHQAGRELHMKAGQSVVLDAGVSITLKAGGGTIVLNPSGVSITGKKVRINSGGGGGSAKAASPAAPRNPGAVDPGKPGNKLSPGRNNIVHRVEKIPFGTGVIAGPVEFPPTKPSAPAKYQAVMAQPYTQPKPLSPEQKARVATAQANARDTLVDDPEDGYASALIGAAPNTVHAHLEEMDAIENAHEETMERYAGEGVMYEGGNWGQGQKSHEQKRAELTEQRNNVLVAEAGNLETHVSGEMKHTTVIEDVLGVGALAGVAAKAGVKTAAKVFGANTKPGKVTTQAGGIVTNKEFSISGAAQFSRIKDYSVNPNGLVRSRDEAVALARSHGIEIPGDINIQFVSNWKRADADAEYFDVGFRYKPDDWIEWNDFMAHRGEFAGTVPVRINQDILNSDEAILANISHEMHELNSLKTLFDQRGALQAKEIARLVNTRDRGGVSGNIHEQAWDISDALIFKIRGGN